MELHSVQAAAPVANPRLIERLFSGYSDFVKEIIENKKSGYLAAITFSHGILGSSHGNMDLRRLHLRTNHGHAAAS